MEENGMCNVAPPSSGLGSNSNNFLNNNCNNLNRVATTVDARVEGKRLPISMSERKGEEMPTFLANSRKDKSALSRNSRSRWPKEISIMCQLNKLAVV